MSTTLNLRSSSRTEQGRRSTNDDCVIVDVEIGLYVVCDGARGRFGGRTAAELAVAAIRAGRGELLQLDTVEGTAQQAVEQLLFAAHRRILAAQAQDSSLEGMTTTVALVLHRGRKVHVAHMGDTRIYLYRGGELQLLTSDHNLENYMRDNPGFRPKVNVSGKTLVRALGLKTQELAVDHKQLSLEQNDRILINTDGLTDSVPGLTLRHILDTTAYRSEDEVTTALVRAALNHGSMDNVSLILLHATDRVDVAGPRTTVFEVESIVAKPQAKSVVLGWLTFLDEPNKGKVVPLEASTVIGADPGCKILVQQDYISAHHAEVLCTEHGFVLRDLGSTNGTFVNNIRATTEEVCLVDGDMLRVGTREMVFKNHRLEQ